jgi:hypothetical protein
MVNYHWSRISEQVSFCTTAPYPLAIAALPIIINTSGKISGIAA